MFIAKVIGKVIATQKMEKLIGSKLLVVKPVDENNRFVENSVYVAIDSVGAGIDDIVLVDWGSAIYDGKKLAADMTIVGIVDEIQKDEGGLEGRE